MKIKTIERPRTLLGILFSIMLLLSTATASRASDFQTRCNALGVVRCFGFDSQTEANPYIYSGDSTPIVDTTVTASGTGSLKMTIPSNSGSDSSGSFAMNFTPDSLNFSSTNPYPVQFDEGEEFYVQWRQRFSPEFLNTYYQGGGGWKQAIIGTGDRAGVPAYSCTQLEIVTQNTYQRGFSQMYHSCGGKDGHYESLNEPLPPYDFKLQNGIPSPYCLYSTGAQGYPNCFKYKANQWMTFQVHVKIGTWYKNDSNYKRDSTIQLWVAEEGQPSKLVIDYSPENSTGYDIANNSSVAKYGKVWLLPYHTGKSASQSHSTAYTWYDDLIVSRMRIPDPDSSGTTQQPPTAPTNLNVN